MKPHWYKKGILYILLITFLFAKLTVIASDEQRESKIAKTAGISMEITYGYDQYVKYGRFMQVSVYIVNNGSDFNGWLQVIVPKQKNNTIYRKEVSVSAKGNKKVTMSLPIMDDSGIMQVKLLNEKQNTVVEKKCELKIGNYEKLAYVGLLSDKKEDLEYLGDYGTRLFYLNESSMPDDYLGLDMIDILVINNFDTSRLSDKQVEAIQKWIKEGGTLVIGTGEYSKETLNKFYTLYHIDENGKVNDRSFTFGMNEDSLQNLKQDLLDYEEERKIFLETINNRNEELRSLGKKTIDIDNGVFQKWTKDKITELTLETINKNVVNLEMQDSSVILWEGNQILMRLFSDERGNIQLFSFDLGLDKSNTTLGLSVLNTIRKHMSNWKLTQLESEYYGNYFSYGIYNSLSYTDAKNVPVVGKYILVLLIYLFIIGPLTYFVLRKLDKRNLTWIVVPGFAVVFTLLVYYLGSDTRINEPYSGYVKLLSFEKDNQVDEDLYFSLTAPFNNDYSIQLDTESAIYELKENGDNSFIYDYPQNNKVDYDTYITSINYEKNNTELKVNDNPAFSPVYYQAGSSYNLTSPLKYEIHYTGDKFYGSVTNVSDSAVTNAMLMSDGYIINLGTINIGETISVNEKTAVYLCTKDEIYTTDIINKIAGGTGDVKDNTVETNRLSNILYYLVEGCFLDEEHSSYILGFVNGDQSSFSNSSGETEKANKNLLGELEKKMKIYGTTAVKIPIEVDYSSGNKVFVPSIDPFITITEGYYDKNYKARYLSTDNSTLEYKLPWEDKVLSFEYKSSRNQESSSDYLTAFNGKIYFLNIKTGEYDEVFQKGLGDRVTEVGNYLTENNTITIRYSTEMSLNGYQMLLPYISYWKEADGNVGN